VAVAHSPLELLHPDGVVCGTAVIGSGCPQDLRPARIGAADRHDLVVWAPTRSEIETPGWLEDAARAAAEGLAQNGLVYVLAPPRNRRRALRVLSRHGLSTDLAMLHLPSSTASHYLVPLAPGPGAYALSSLIPVRSGRRRIALAALALPGGRSLLAHALPFVAVAMRRAGSRPLFEWLFRLDGAFADAPSAIITSSRGDGGKSFVLHRFSSSTSVTSAVAKVRAAPASSSVVAEAEILDCQAVAARKAGADLPRPLLVQALDGRTLVLETVVAGRSAAAVLGESPRRLLDVQARIARWIEAWNGATAALDPLTSERLEEDLLAPARLLAPQLDRGAEYASWLTTLAAGVANTTVPLVATHNDLTMSNIFVTETGGLGIVDWEAGRDRGLPLTDFFYAAADAAAAARRYRGRLQAFVESFAEQGARTTTIRGLQGNLTRSLDLAPPLVEICFHACWLHHAANEHRAVPTDGERPFLEILRWVVKHRGHDGGSR
jgi:hypothetical protein